MEFKRARETLGSEPHLISLEKINEDLLNQGSVILYLDKENSAKDIKKMEESFRKEGYSVHCHEVHYGLDSEDYVYEIHIIR